MGAMITKPDARLIAWGSHMNTMFSCVFVPFLGAQDHHAQKRETRGRPDATPLEAASSAKNSGEPSLALGGLLGLLIYK